MRAGELIGGPVVTCGAYTEIADAAKTMLAEEVGALAVMENTRLVGIVTERDLLRVVAERPRGPLPVGRIMTPSPDFLSPDVEVDDAAEWMMAAGYRHLPVVEKGRIIGMVSIKDVLWALTDQRRRRPVERA